MENCRGKTAGLCLPRGWMAVAVGSWTLWIIIIIIIPLVGSSAAAVSSCPDESGVDIPCPLNELVGVNCTYTKGIPARLPELPIGKTNFPGSVRQLTVQPYLKNDVMYLNITWKIGALGFRNLNGFILNATFVYAGIQRYIYRTYSLSVEDWNDRSIFETAFRHECIVPSMNSPYRIEVLSLPLSTDDSSNVAAIYYEHRATYFYPKDNPVSTYDWIAPMWMTRGGSWEEDSLRSSSFDICFFLAPLSFGFKKYRMDLMHANSSIFQLTLQTAFLHNNGTQKRHECVTFVSVCPGIYTVHLLPLAEIGSCTCRAGPNDCRDSCTATVFEPIDMTESVCKPPGSSQPPSTTTPASPPPPDTTTLPPTTSGHPPLAPVAAATDSDRSKTVGIAVVAATAAIVVVITTAVVVVVILALLRKRREEKVPFRNSAVVPFLSLEKQPSA